MTLPRLTVIYGQPERYSTSFQTSQLVRRLTRWYDVRKLPLGSGAEPWGLRQIRRLAVNYLKPMFLQPRTDAVLYGNDGMADLRRWRARRLLYWYDAPWDWSSRPPARHQFLHWLRYCNVIAAHHVFAVSQTQVEVAHRLRPGRDGSVTYLPVGVDCSAFDPAKTDGGQIKAAFGLAGKTIIGYLGYLGCWGGRFAGQILAEAAPSLLQQHRVHFLVVGFGPALPMFKQRVHDLGIAGDFTFTGYVEDARLPECIAAMDICVDTLEPGFHSEARSETKLKQYMAMGRACVATAIGENRVDLAHGQCGVLVGSSREELVRGLSSLCDQPQARAELGKAARSRAESVYDWSLLAERMATTLHVGWP